MVINEVIRYVLVFLLGASIGSFLNVLVSRTIEGESWVMGRSRCDCCKRELSWYEMIPVISYLIYGGKARCCGCKLSYRHLLVEVGVGLVLVWWMMLGTMLLHLVVEPAQTIQLLFWIVTSLALLAIMMSDQFYGVIPLPFLWFGMIILWVYRFLLIYWSEYHWLDVGWSLLAGMIMASWYLFLRWITKGRGMGEGDVWLALYLGMLVGWQRLYWATAWAFILGAVVGLSLIVLGKKTRKDTLPFGPYMILGSIVSLIWG